MALTADGIYACNSIAITVVIAMAVLTTLLEYVDSVIYVIVIAATTATTIATPAHLRSTRAIQML